MKLTVVVPTHGRRDLLDRLLASLREQRDAPAFDVVIVDDGVDPALGEHVAAQELPFPVRVLHHETNRGRSATRNTGLAAATGDVVVFLDGDMRVCPEFLAAHAAAHAVGDVALGNIVTAPEVRRNAFVEYIDSRGVKKVANGTEIPPRYFMTGNSSVARELTARAGGFDPEFDEYGGEDTEMGYRLAAHGARFAYAERAVSWHLDLNSVPRMAERLRRYGERMLPILVRKVPESYRELRLGLIDGDPSAGSWVSRHAARLLCRRAFWAPAAWIGERLPRGIPAAPLFDFVRAAAYLDGWRHRARGGRG